MGDGLAHVAVEALLAVVAVSASSVVAAVETDAPALAPRQLVELHIESAAPSMEVAVAGCRGNRQKPSAQGERKTDTLGTERSIPAESHTLWEPFLSSFAACISTDQALHSAQAEAS